MDGARDQERQLMIGEQGRAIVGDESDEIDLVGLCVPALSERFVTFGVGATERHVVA